MKFFVTVDIRTEGGPIDTARKYIKRAVKALKRRVKRGAKALKRAVRIPKPVILPIDRRCDFDV